MIIYAKCASGDIVYLEGRRAGTIIRWVTGWAYVPQGQPRHKHGPVYDSIEDVERSLEGED